MKKGFTLTELLAVIVILAIIAVIATPLIMNLIEESRKKALIATAYGLIDGAKNYVVKNVQIYEEELPLVFTIANKEFVGRTIDMEGGLPNNGNVAINQEIESSVAITDGKWCAKKEYTTMEVVITSDTDNCYIAPETPESCFAFTSSTGTITNYYDNEGNNINNPACPKDVVIPTRIGGVETRSIDNNAFNNKALTSVIIPEGITSIGNSAFRYNNLVSFSTPTTITSIGTYAFANNPTLRTVYINNGTIGDYVSYGNSVTDLILDEGVTSVGISAFRNNVINNLILSDTIETIGDNAFYGNEITDLVLPKHLKTVGQYAFESNNISRVVFNDELETISMHSFGENSLTMVNIPDSVKTIGYWAFALNLLNDVIIGKNANSIAGSAFVANPNLNRIMIDADNQYYKSVNNAIYTKDGTTLITGTKNMSNNIEPTVTTIEVNAFYWMGLTSVTIPDSVTKINTYAFRNNDISTIHIPANVSDIRHGIYTGNHNISTVTVDPLNVTYKSVNNGIYTKDGTTLIQGSKYAANNMATGVTTICTDSFFDLDIHSVTIANTVTTIEGDAFYYNDIASLVIPDSVTQINAYAFEDNALTSVTLGRNVQTIGAGAFDYNHLTNITIPSSVTNIGNYAFYYNQYSDGLSSATVRYNGTNLANRFDSIKASIGWGRATMTYVSD